MTVSSVSRRTVVASAWAVPVVAASVAAPAAAASQCSPVTHFYRPDDYPVGSSMGPDTNIAEISVAPGRAVVVTVVKDYPNASALNVDGAIRAKSDRGWKVGDVVSWPLEACSDPFFVQFDGNNTHYYGGGRFA